MNLQINNIKKAVAEALRQRERKSGSRKKQCLLLNQIFQIMKKLKKMKLHDARLLSKDEMAAIEGGLVIDALDNCTPETRGAVCVYSVSYDASGTHQIIALGTCQVFYEQVDRYVIAKGACV